jgi:hypothetical protein
MQHRLLRSAALTIRVAPAPVKRGRRLLPPADGHPDLQGSRTHVTLTPMERPAQFAGRPPFRCGSGRLRQERSETNNTTIRRRRCWREPGR